MRGPVGKAKSAAKEATQKGKQVASKGKQVAQKGKQAAGQGKSVTQKAKSQASKLQTQASKAAPSVPKGARKTVRYSLVVQCSEFMRLCHDSQTNTLISLSCCAGVDWAGEIRDPLQIVYVLLQFAELGFCSLVQTFSPASVVQPQTCDLSRWGADTADSGSNPWYGPNRAKFLGKHT